MEFKGRIKQILPLRSGVSQRTGNEWKAQPFVFEYFENATDRYADSVLLETYDTKVMETMQEGMEVICGFGHRTREYECRTYNELRLYKFEAVTRTGVETPGTAAGAGTAAAATGGTDAEASGTVPPAGAAAGEGEADDLPF